jgi:hypothetical protein
LDPNKRRRRLAVFGFSLFGDAVRDELDPKLRSR